MFLFWKYYQYVELLLFSTAPAVFEITWCYLRKTKNQKDDI